MEKKLEPIRKITRVPETEVDRSELARRVQLSLAQGTLAPSPSVPAAPAHRRELPATHLQLEPRPLSAYDDNPVLDEISAARVVGVSADCLKKWRQRKQGPDYIQYRRNGAVRYELKALMEFRDRHRVSIGSSK